jgi:NADH-quinone oxidoreductase subunit C
MTPLSADELKRRMAQELPGALAPAPERRGADGDGPAAPKKGERAPVDLLATDDAVVHAAHLPEAARYLRDALGYELLSNITAVDYLADGVIELVYHFFHLGGGAPLVLKLRLPRDNPRAPSIVPEWPGAELQEREAFDLYGVVFDGHPNLTRVYMWDEFEGFPMRKDFPRQGDKYFGDEEDD